MRLEESSIKKIISYVKKEPCTVQDIARLIGRSWVTTNSYLEKIKQDTGLIGIKTFRKGTQAALRIVFYSQAEGVFSDEIKEFLFHQIRSSRAKQDFDFMDIYQFIPDRKKKAFTEEYDDNTASAKGQKIIPLLRQAKSSVYCFSGNLSFINMKEGKTSVLSVIEELARRKVMFKILCRVNIASMENINKLSKLVAKYPETFEMRHCYQPLRGFVIDDKIARFKQEEDAWKYKKGELDKNTRIFYEIFDEEWIAWLQKVFWSLFRSSFECKERAKELKKIF